MVEQVLLNLTRNGIQAMDTGDAAADRVLTLRVRQTHARWVTFSVIDRGAGIAPDTGAATVHAVLHHPQRRAWAWASACAAR